MGSVGWSRYQLPSGHGWTQHPVGFIDHLPDAPGDPGKLEIDPGTGQRLYGVLPAARNRHAGGIPVTRPDPLLCFLGVLTYPDVFPDRYLGWRTSGLCSGQVLPVHHGRLSLDADCHPVPGHQRRNLLGDGIDGVVQVWRKTSNSGCSSPLDLAFAIKVPIWPLHTWLPDAHVEAPTAGSVILAGVLLKMGTYGFLRFNLGLFPQIARQAAPWLAGLAVIGIIYGAAVAYMQKDVKKLVAYSSVSHLGFVILGLFALNMQGIEGAILQMVNHGLSTGALFLIVGMLYERRHTRELDAYGGLWKAMPVLGSLALIVTLSSLGLPGLNGFVGEFTILLGAFNSTVLSSFWFAGIATLGVILAAVYLLHMFQKVFLGRLDKPENRALKDLSWREILIFAPILVLIVWIGIYPQPFFDLMEPAVSKLLMTIP